MMEALSDQANAAFAAGDWARAFVDAQRAIAVAARNPALLRVAALACLAQNKPDAALPYAEAWDLLDPSLEAKRALQHVYGHLNKPSAFLAISRQITVLAPEDPDAWFWLGHALAAIDPAGAAEAFLRVFILQPTRVMALGNWFYLSCMRLPTPEVAATLRGLIARGLPVSGECVAQRYLLFAAEAEHPPFDPHRVLTWDDLGCRAVETDARWRALARAWWAETPASPEAAENFIFAALADHTLETLDTAITVVHSHTPRNVVGTYITDPRDFAALDARWDAELGPFPPTRVIAQSFTAAPRAFFFGCDQGYFDKFGAALMDSFLRHAPTVPLHIHVINPDEARLRALFEAIPQGALLRITAEEVDPAKTAIPEYAHVARFVRIAQMLDDYPDQLWMMDTDSLCRRDPSWLFTLADDGVALLLQPARVDCHNIIGACLMGIGPSAQARRYLRLVAAYIARSVSQNRLAWGCDQAAMYLTMLYLRGIGAAPGIAGIPTGIMNAGADAIFYPSKT